MARTFPATPAECGHRKIGIDEPALWDEVVGGGVDGGIAEDGEVVCDYGCACGDSIAVVCVILS